MSPAEMLKVGGLKPGLGNVSLHVKILNIGSTRIVPSKRDQSQHQVAEAVVGDETGSVVLTLWDDQIQMFKPEEVVRISYGYTTLFKGSLRLNISRGGQIEKTDKEIGEVNTRNNLSEQTHIQIPWRLSEAHPFKRRRRR